MWAKVRLCRISASSVVVFGTRSPQNLLQEPYPDGTRVQRSKVKTFEPPILLCWGLKHGGIGGWKQVSHFSYLIYRLTKASPEFEAAHIPTSGSGF